MDFDRHCTEIVTQTDLLVRDAGGADLRAPVPSCPGWTLGALARHVDGGHRWAEQIVRTRATAFPDDTIVRDVLGDDSGPLPADDLREGAQGLAATLRAAGPGAEVWGPFHFRSTTFWARRFAHETLMHRADTALAAGTPFAVEPEVALDAVDEWMELDVLPQHFDLRPEKRDLLAPGRTLALEATDRDAAWFVDLTGPVITWRRGAGEAAVTVRAPLTDLLLLIYRRHDGAGLQVAGDAALLDLWLHHVAFG
ncbi:maleylpyruvate isomerase family mycothiol-dependent enzyme [Pseudonocardia halophobica]|uniref:Maleylpyruvate isomerase family mycothiol-dependent enzyme n=1 Tax=Pseudonocardia halophobica TaxID=29401 RepID=A0A9W6NU84_9PSEU|nr:maleylpyruvate isomerase family mycothiol-dependent enzyme [Pseudonocardia halophobica]GLL09027.1 hypothetical protein GCM10017577_01670 [Pseudonocardia halophobica]